MVNTEKMTKREKFEMILALDAVQSDAMLTEFIQHEIDLLTKHSGGVKKPTEKQNENEVIKTAIYDGMEENRLYRIGELCKEIPACAGLASQRVSALVKQMKDAGLVTRTMDKRVAYFTKA